MRPQRRDLSVAEPTVIVQPQPLQAEVHAAHLRRRQRDQPARRGQRHLDHFQAIRRTQRELRDLARRRGVAEYDISDPSTLTQGLVEELAAIAATARVSA